MEHDSEDEQLIIKQCMSSGRPLPSFIADAPDLKEGLQLYFQAFSELSTTRSVGMGAGPIPWTAIVMWAQLAELSDLQTEALQYHIQVMDTAYLKHQGAKVSE